MTDQQKVQILANAYNKLQASFKEKDEECNKLTEKNKKLENKLDSLFAVSSHTTGRQQSDITGLIGQYAHGNEPTVLRRYGNRRAGRLAA